MRLQMPVAMDTSSVFHVYFAGVVFPAMDSKSHLQIVGLIKDRNFHIARSIAEVNSCFTEVFFCCCIFYVLKSNYTFDFAH